MSEETGRTGRTAFEEAYLTHKDRLLTLAAAFLGDRHAAEDVVHDVFAGLLSQSGQPWNGRGAAAYLTTCVRNRAIDRLRKGGRAGQPAHDGGKLAEVAAKVSSALPEDEAQRLLMAVSLLPEDLREAVSLRIWGEMSFEEIGRLQSVTKSTAHTRYCYALEQLRIGITGGFQK